MGDFAFAFLFVACALISCLLVWSLKSSSLSSVTLYTPHPSLSSVTLSSAIHYIADHRIALGIATARVRVEPAEERHRTEPKQTKPPHPSGPSFALSKRKGFRVYGLGPGLYIVRASEAFTCSRTVPYSTAGDCFLGAYCILPTYPHRKQLRTSDSRMHLE